MALNEALQKIGLNDKEIKVYSTLLRTGRLTPAAISRLTKISRPTVYNIANSLLEKGIIAEDLGGKTLYLNALPADSIQHIVETFQRELREKEALVKKAIEEVSLIAASKSYPIPKIRFVEEGDLEDFLYDNFLKWQHALSDKDYSWWGFQDHSLVEHYEEWILWTWKQKEYQDPRCHAYLLSNDSKIEQKLGERLSRARRDIRFAEGMNFTTSVWVAGSYLVMIMTRGHPFYLVEIHDAALAHNMREVFKRLWKELYGDEKRQEYSAE